MNKELVDKYDYDPDTLTQSKLAKNLYATLAFMRKMRA